MDLDRLGLQASLRQQSARGSQTAFFSWEKKAACSPTPLASEDGRIHVTGACQAPFAGFLQLRWQEMGSTQSAFFVGETGHLLPLPLASKTKEALRRNLTGSIVRAPFIFAGMALSAREHEGSEQNLRPYRRTGSNPHT